MDTFKSSRDVEVDDGEQQQQQESADVAPSDAPEPSAFPRGKRKSVTLIQFSTDEQECVEAASTQAVIRQMFVFVLAWTVGGNLSRERRLAFDAWLLTHCAGDSQHCRDLSNALPPGSVYDYTLDLGAHNWIEWDSCIAPTMFKSGSLEAMPALLHCDNRVDVAELWIPTTQALASATIIQLLVSTDFPVMLAGPSASGKTHIMRQAMKRLREDEGYLPMEFCLSRQQGTAEYLKGSVAEHLEHRRNDLLGPPNRQKMALFVDDLNLGGHSSWASSSEASELLRGLLEQRGWHPLHQTAFHRVEDVRLLACSDGLNTQTSGAGHRLQRHFLTLFNDAFEVSTLASITQTMLALRFSAPGELLLWRGLEAVGSVAFEMYSTAARHFCLTPSTPHYVFDANTYFSILQGVLVADPTCVLDLRGQLPRLLVHEAMRSLGDGLSSDEDQQWLLGNLVTVAKAHFKDFRMDTQELATLHFGDSELLGDMGYAEIDPSLLWNRTYAKAREFAQREGVVRFPVGFVLFQEASSHILRILRVLRVPRGHLLLGERGTGRRTLATLALHIAGMTVYECRAPTAHMDDAEVASSLAATRERFWEAMNVAAIDDRHVVILLTVEDVRLSSSQALLDDIQQVLTFGEIAEQITHELRVESSRKVKELFTQKMQQRAEVETHTGHSKSKQRQTGSHKPTLSEQLQAEGMRITTKASFRSPDPFYGRFVTSVLSSLHAVCIVDIEEDKSALRESLRANPALLKCCAVDYFGQWSEPALKAVAQAHFDLDPELQKDANLSAADVGKAVSCLALVHCSTRAYARQLLRGPSTTPNDVLLNLPWSLSERASSAQHDVRVLTAHTGVLAFTELVLTFKQHLRSRHACLSSKLKLLETTIEASRSLTLEMGDMEEADFAEVSASTKTELGAVNQSIEQEAARVEMEEAVTLKKAEEIAAEAKAAQGLADAAREALEAAMPELERAEVLLGSITKQDIAELKGFRVPPESIMLTVEALCIVLGTKPKRVEAGKASKTVAKGARTPRCLNASTENSPRATGPADTLVEIDDTRADASAETATREKTPKKVSRAICVS